MVLDPPQPRVAPAALRGARVAAHWAAQALAAVAGAHLVPAADDSHTSLEWLASRQVQHFLGSALAACRALLSLGGLAHG